VLIHQKRDFKLGSNAVCSAYQNRLFNALCIKLEQPAEAAHVGAHAGSHSFGDMLFHQLNRLVSCGYIHASGGIAIGF